ncbi:cellulase [Streptomyces shenzhenensis]|uniref:Cellulase n=1 Tax=Streptomyces shenzhenensis TaxID=943815 RepID=A0A3M0I349_9ACTN|nr:cellulase [Streptomyces shenzhenensis]
MDHFERQLARMMHDAEEPAPFGPRHRKRLREGVSARRRARAAKRAVGSVLTLAGLSVGLFLLSGDPTRAEPGEPRPLPATRPSPPSPVMTPGAASPSPTSTETSDPRATATRSPTSAPPSDTETTQNAP